MDGKEEGVWLAEPQPPCPVTPGWLCDKAGDLTAPGERHIFNRGSLRRQQVWCQWVTRFVLSRFDFVQIHALIERMEVVLQLGLSARISLQCVCLLITSGHRNQGPDSPGNL